MRTLVAAIVFALASAAVGTSPTPAAEPGCARCGCGACEKTCRLICEEKKVTITCWGCVCEDFCLGGPSHRGCKHCEEVCESCPEGDGKTPTAQAKPWVWYDWIPGCSAQLYTKKKLMKRTITKTVPSFKWVVEDLCPKCQSQVKPSDLPKAADAGPVPPPPPGVKVISG